MFQSTYPGCPFLELLQAKGSEPLKQFKWKQHGVKTVFVKEVKGNVFDVDADSSRLQLPADDKMTMHLTMGTLVIQGLINSTFAIQLRVSDLKGDQRRIHLSTAVLGIDCTVHHARLPMPFVKRNAWINLVIDIAGIVKECFKVDFFCLDFILVQSSCRVKRVFAMIIVRVCRLIWMSLMRGRKAVTAYHHRWTTPRLYCLQVM